MKRKSVLILTFALAAAFLLTGCSMYRATRITPVTPNTASNTRATPGGVNTQMTRNSVTNPYGTRNNAVTPNTVNTAPYTGTTTNRTGTTRTVPNNVTTPNNVTGINNRTSAYVPQYSAYDTFDNMYSGTDVVIKGVVSSVTPRNQYDYLYTTYKVTANEVYSGNVRPGETIEIVQARNTANTTGTNSIGTGSPTLSQGKEYFFFLDKVSKTDVYADHYLIAGENQGYAEVYGGTSLRTSSGLLRNDFTSADELVSRIQGRTALTTRY